MHLAVSTIKALNLIADLVKMQMAPPRLSEDSSQLASYVNTRRLVSDKREGMEDSVKDLNMIVKVLIRKEK